MATIATEDLIELHDETARVVLDTVPAMLAYIDREERYRLTNIAFRSWFGEVFGDVRGRSLREVFGPAAYEVIRGHVARALGGEMVSFESRMPHASGMRWLHTDYVPHRDRDGGIAGFVSQVYDITARKLAEERLAILSDAGRSLGAALDERSALHALAGCLVPAIAEWAIVFVHRQGGVVHVGEIAHVPRLARERIAETAHALLPRPGEHDLLRRVLATCEHVVLDGPTLATGPEPLIALGGSIVVTPLVARGCALGAVVAGSARRALEPGDVELVDELGRRAGTALDTAQLFEAQSHTNEQLADAVERLASADRRKDEFLAMLGHELRNPLAPIVTALDLLDIRSPETTLRERTAIRRHTGHLRRLIDDLLDVSRVARGKLELRRERTNLRARLGDAIDLATPLIEQRRHRLAITGDDAIFVDGDPVRLAQIFGNLLVNAAKYTDPGGEIAVTIERADDRVHVVVSDNGSGIAPDLLPRIFDAFVQSQRTIDRAQGGLGLGLALVRSLIELHGGSVYAHSDGAGKGSRFVVELPISNNP